MANDNVVWAVSGPVDHDPRLAREQTFATTNGATGIIRPDHLQVRATPTPGKQVRILPGAFAIAATAGPGLGYTNAPGQSYSKTLYQVETVEIRPTSSVGGRTDVVGIIIDDPEFEGTAEDIDYDTHRFWRPHVVENAGNNATRPEHFATLRRPFLPLAQIRIPASTGTIDQSMIRDLRQMTKRNTETRTFIVEPNVSSGRRIGPNDTEFVDLEPIQVSDIPPWANRVIVDGEITSLIVRDGTGTGTTAVGSGRLRGQLTLGSTVHRTPQTQMWQNENWERFTAPIAGNLIIPAGHQAGVFVFQMRYGDRGNGSIQIHEGTYFSCFYRLRLTFEEAPI